MKSDGRLVKCDNCGNTVFLKRLEDKVLDGGYTRVDTYEDIPKGWVYEHMFGKSFDLCPECALKLKSAVSEHLQTLAGLFPQLAK